MYVVYIYIYILQLALYIHKYAHAHTYHNTSLYGDIPDNAPAMRVVVDSPKCA